MNYILQPHIKKTQPEMNEEATRDFWTFTGTCRSIGQHKTKYACTVEADESVRIRMEESQSKNHEDHIAGTSMKSLSRHNLVHKFIPMPEAMKIPDAKAAVEKELEKCEKIPVWQLTKVKNKSEVIAEARNEGKTVHFASLMDLCHLKNSPDREGGFVQTRRSAQSWM